MRTVFFFFSWFLIAACYALKVIALESPVIDAAPYLESGQKGLEGQLQPKDSEEFPLPVISRIKPGIVSTHSNKNSFFSQAFFVVGNDDFSRAWLKAHATQLQRSNALGLVTNVATTQALHELMELAGLPLQPVDVDEIASLLKVNHYPFAYDAGFVWQ